MDSTPYYSRFYNPKKDDQVSEMQLKGLSVEELVVCLENKTDGTIKDEDGSKEDAKQIWRLTKGKPAALHALAGDDLDGLKALGLSTEESRLLLFLKDRMLGK